MTDADAGEVHVPYVIKMDEASGGTSILIGTDELVVKARGVLTTRLPETFFDTVYLVAADGAFVAMDVLAKGVKESLEFDAINSAKAEVVLALSFTGLSNSDILASYSTIQDNPRFQELVEMYRRARRVPLNDTARSIAHEIAIEIYANVRTETN